MIIINKNADFSQCGIGQLVYKVDDDVNALLDASYENLDFSLKLMFQKFINDIGGLNGEIYSSLKKFVIPAFAATIKECYTDVKTGSTFNPGGGAYPTYEGKVTLNRGVGANYESTAVNGLNFNATSFPSGTRFIGIICDGVNKYEGNRSVAAISSFPMHTHTWQIPFDSTPAYGTQPVLYGEDPHVFLYNQGNTKADCLSYCDGKYPEVDSWRLPSGISEFDLAYAKSLTSNGYSWLGIGGDYPLITVKMYILGDGLTRNQVIQLGNAMKNFYDNF
jgi:hypothetical protein